MKRTLTLALTLILSVIAYYPASAQVTTVFTQSFDSTTSFTRGWYATPNSWYLDTTNGNISSGYNNATGGNNMVVKDTSARLGYDSLISPAIITSGYGSITVEWGARFSKHYADSGSTIGLYWSTNRTTWTNVSYTENTNNSTWGLENGGTPVALPAGANNQATLWLMWLADIHFTPSGTYRIDDVNVTGTPLAGINDVNADAPFVHVYTSTSSIMISAEEALTESLSVEVYDMTGRMVTSAGMDKQSLSINTQNLSKGLYLVRVSDSVRNSVTKVSIKE